MWGSTLPGNTSSCDGAVRCGETTLTDGTAIVAVSALTVARARTRRTMPETKIPATARTAIRARSHLRLARYFALKALCFCGAFATTCVSCDIGTPFLLVKSFYFGIPDSARR